MSIYDAAMRYQAEGAPLVVLAGKEYGSGSSRDWAAKGTTLLGVQAVLAESFERIHRSNLIGMGVLPLQFLDGDVGRSSASPATRCSASPGVEAMNGGPVPQELTVRVDDQGPERPPGAGSKEFNVALPHRHAQGGRLLPPRRHPPVRRPPAGQGLTLLAVDFGPLRAESTARTSRGRVRSADRRPRA